MRRRSSPANRARWELSAGPGFDPRDVPEVAAGYFWEASNTTGFGTAAFRVLEGNGHSTFDLVQATVANQPTVLTENGGQQFRMRATTDPNPASMRTVGSVTAGWTGPTYVAGWFRLPDNGGLTTSFGEVFLQHSGASGFRRIQLPCGISSAVQCLTCSISGDGAGASSAKAASPMVGANWRWLEWAFDPLFVLGGSLPADRVKLFSNFSLLTIIQTSGTLPASLFDASTPLAVGCYTSQAPPDTTDWAACYYPNGIPSLANRVRLANRANPTGILLS